MQLLFDHPRQIHDAIIRALPEKSRIENEQWINDGHGKIAITFTWHNHNFMITGFGTVFEYDDGVRTNTICTFLLKELLIRSTRP